jgi:hypothetical protein
VHTQVAKGQADPSKLEKEKQRLGQMQQQLDTLEVEKAKTANRASSLLSFLGIGGSKQQKQQQQEQQEKEQPQQRPAAGSGWQSLLGGRSRSSSQQQQAAAQAASAPAASSSSSSSGSASKVLLQAWESLGQQLLRLEGQLNEQESRTERQRISVQRLQQKVRGARVTILQSACSSHCAAAAQGEVGLWALHPFAVAVVVVHGW